MTESIEELLEDTAEYAFKAAENGENLEDVKNNIKTGEAQA